MLSSALAPSTVIDLAAIPWPTVMILLGAAFILLEARLVKGGFVKRDALDGLGARLDAKIATGDSGREVLERGAIMLRTDLDDTRDRVTRLEMTVKAVEDRVDEHIIKPLGRIEDKVDILVGKQSYNEADIDGLKASVRRLEDGRPSAVPAVSAVR